MDQLDPKRLRTYIKSRRADRPDGIGPGGHATTGSMAIVRANLDLFDRMRKDDPGLTWDRLAEGLAEQGMIQSGGAPITGKRLCALISTIRKQRVAQEQAATERGERRDIAAPRRTAQGRGALHDRRLTLASDLVDTEQADTSRPQTITEEDRRHAGLDRAKTILKKD